MDPNQKEGEMLAEEIINTVNGKFCVDCKTTKTPLWRSGPAGPKTLCNACGIRHRKKRASTLCFNKDQDKKKRDYKEKSSKKKRINVGTGGKDDKLGEYLRTRLTALGKEVVLLQRQRSLVKRQRNNNSHRELREVEQAAVLLMALSCGSVFA